MAPFLTDMKIGFVASLLFVSLGSLMADGPELIGPYGGAAAIVQTDSRHGGVVVAATTNAMLFRSTNGGDSWTRLPFPAELRGTLHAFVIAPRTSFYFAGIASDDSEYSGIFLSEDDGKTWTRTLEDKNIWSVAIWPGDPRVIAAGAADGVFLTQDGGEHWSRISPESNVALRPVVSLDFDPTNEKILYAGTPHLPWKTINGGATWQRAQSGMANDSDVFSIHVDLSRRTRIFASACSGIYRSSNEGLSWIRLAGASDTSTRTYQITQHPRMPNLLFAGTTRGLVRSADGGAHWRKLSPHMTRSIAFDPVAPNRIYVATDDAGLLRSDDQGQTLRPINTGFCNRRVFSLAALGATLYASWPSSITRAAVFRNEKGGTNWERIDSVSSWGEQQALRILSLDPTHLYALTSKTVLLSANAGQSWLALGPPGGSRLTALLARAGGKRLFVGTENEIYFTEDGGQTWQHAQTPQGQFPIRSLVAVGSRGVAALTDSSVLVSSDGKDYSLTASLAADSEIHGLVATDEGDLLAATSHGLKRSEDFGVTWHTVSGVLDGNSVSALCKHPSRTGLLFAAQYGSIFSSVDNGRTWQAVTSPDERLPPIQELVVASGIQDGLFAITPAEGIYFVRLKPELAWTECRNRTCGTVRIQVP